MPGPARKAVQQVGAGGIIGTNLSDSAVAVMCWDNGGMHLVGLMVVRREDGHACFVELPPELEQQLATLDRQFVADHAVRLLKLAYEGLSVCEFEKEEVISREFLQQGHHPATAGTMRHIPAEQIPCNPPGIETWQAAGFFPGWANLPLSSAAKAVHRPRQISDTTTAAVITGASARNALGVKVDILRPSRRGQVSCRVAAQP